jgi:hypothetical protein
MEDIDTFGPLSVSLSPPPGKYGWPDRININHGELTISFRRTIRVPDKNGITSLLPPDLGTFPLFPVQVNDSEPAFSTSDAEGGYPGECSIKLPEQMAKKGGVFFPMHSK